MPFDMRETEMGKRPGDVRQRMKPLATLRGPWGEFFYRLREAAKPIWAFYIVCALALLTVCSMMGTPVTNPLNAVELSSTSLVSGNGASMVVVDQMRTRLLFVNDAMQVASIVETGRGVVPVDEIYDVVLGDDVVYAAGLTRMADGKSVASEAVLTFDLDGTYRKTIWQESYDESSYRITPSVVDLEVDDDGVVVVQRTTLGERSQSVELLHVREGQQGKALGTIDIGTPFYDACYEGMHGRFFFISVDGGVRVIEDGETSTVPNSSDRRCKGLDASGDRLILRDALSGELLLIEGGEDGPSTKTVASATCPRSAQLHDDTLYVSLDDGSILIDQLDTGAELHVGELSLAPHLAFAFAKYLLSLALLLVAVVVWGVQAMRGLLEANETDKFRGIVISIVVGLICAVVACLLSYSSYTDGWKTRENELRQLGSYLSYVTTDSLGESVEQATQLIDDQSLSGDLLAGEVALAHAASGLALSAHEGGAGVSCKLYVVSQDGSQVYALVSSDYDVVCGERVFDEELAGAVRQAAATANKSSGDGATSHAERAARTSTFLSLTSGDSALGMTLSPIISADGTCRVVAQVSCQQLTFIRGFLKNALSKILAYGLIAIGFYLVADEVLKLGAMFEDYRRSGNEDIVTLRVRLTRPLSFLHGVMLYMDAALVAVMARSILLSKGVDASALTLSLPVCAASTGMTLSSWVGRPLSRRISMRNVVLTFVIIGLVAQFACFFAILNNWFGWYVVGKLCMSFGYGFVLTPLYDMAYYTPDDLSATFFGIDQAGRSSGIVAGIVGGLVALLGGPWIYAVSAALGALLLWGLWKTLPEDLRGEEKPYEGDEADTDWTAEAAAQASSVNAFLRSPQMLLIVLFGMIPVTIAGGYKSYLLPLFLSASSYTNTEISNFSVLCSLGFYLATKCLYTQREESDSWLVPWVTMAGMGVLFGLFAENQSTSWAILAATLISILCWFAKKCRFLARCFARSDYGLRGGQAYETVSLVNSIVGNVRSPAMGAFLSLGTTTGCIALAAYLFVSSLLYAVTLRPHYQRLRVENGIVD